LSSDKHSDAVAAFQPVGVTSNPSLPFSVEQPRFNLSAMLLDSDSEDDQPQQYHSELDDIMMDGNQFFNAGPNEIFFSAGVEDIGAAHRKVLLEGIQNLDYYDHTMFGKVDREDSTISDAVATMVEMGELGLATQVQTVWSLFIHRIG
jgi:hypothetical protein